MDFTKSALWKDSQKILTQGGKTTKKITAVFHVNGIDYPARKINYLDIERDYHKGFGDTIIVEVLLPMGHYAMRFYPNMDKIECTVSITPSDPDNNRMNVTPSPKRERFKAIMLNPSDRAISLNKAREISEDSLNLTEFATAQFQLINVAVEQLRNVAVGGTYRNARTDDVLVEMLTTHSANIKNVTMNRLPEGVDFVVTTSISEREHINIPPGLKLVQLAEHLQNNCGGIYPAGIACYYQWNHWYVFPPYDLTRYVKARKTLTVINVPKGVAPASASSWIKDGNNYRIVATGESKIANDSEKVLNAAGVGTRFGNANDFMEGFVDVQDNVAIASRGKNVTEYSTIDRPDGNKIVPVSSRRITANQLREMSDLAVRDGALMTLAWENADHEVTHPGMPARILYADDDLTKRVDGVLLHSHFYYYPTPGVESTEHLCEAALTFFIERKQSIHD